jgi:hypothetical protein
VLLALASLFDPAYAARAHAAPGTLLIGTLALIAAGSFGTAVYRTRVIARALARDRGAGG